MKRRQTKKELKKQLQLAKEQSSNPSQSISPEQALDIVCEYLVKQEPDAIICSFIGKDNNMSNTLYGDRPIIVYRNMSTPLLRTTKPSSFFEKEAQ